MSQESFDALNKEFGPWEVDWFASDWSRRLEKFSSRYWTIGGGAPDAFSQRWDQDAGYFHPPLPELARVLEKVETEGARGAILVPDWPGSETDSIMIQAGGMVELMGVRGVVFESPEWRTDDKFRGVSTFGMSEWLRVRGANCDSGSCGGWLGLEHFRPRGGSEWPVVAMGAS